jgi:zinc protease
MRRNLFFTVPVVLLLTGCLAFLQGSIAQERTFKADEVLKPDSKITMGKLDNGLVYYVRENKKPEKRAELRLAVKAGSVIEDDDQLGLAHFTEHMSFNGTKHFPKMDLINFLEKSGVRFGPDLNAYTSFDEIVYMIQVPTDSAEVMQKGFQILGDWASAVAFDKEEIDKERGVVIEEWRLRRGAMQRAMDKHYPVMLENSQYAKRLPIGKKETIESFPYDAVKRYYKDWFRPDLMAVIAIGDFDKNKIEALIKKNFSGLMNPKPERKRTEYVLGEHKETLISIATDPELPNTIVQIFFKRPEEHERTASEYRRNILGQLYNSMLGARFQERLQKPNPPYVFAFGNDSRFYGKKQAYTLYAYLKENAILDGLDAVVEEAFRVKQYGFTKSELDRQKKELLRGMENAYKEREKTESRSYADEFVRNFLTDEPIPGIEAEYDLFKQYIPGISLDEVNKLADKFLTPENRVIILSAPKKEGVKVPTEVELLASFNAASTKKTEPYIDKVSSEPLIAKMPTAGKIVEEKKITSLGITEWKLSNGVRVVLKPTDFKNDEVLFSAYSEGGTSLSPDKDYLSASWAATVAGQSGVGNFDAITLGKMLAGKVVNVYPTIAELSEGFSGSASPEDLETLFQLVYLYFTAPREDTNALGALMARQKAFLQNRSVSPESAFYDTLNVTTANYHFRARPMTLKILDEINFDKAMAIYRDRFADASDFTFMFVGSFQVDKMRPFIEQYLASLPSKNRKETWRDVGLMPPKGTIEKKVYKGIEPKSSVQIVFTGPFEWSRQNRYDFSSLLEVLNIKLREVIREEKGGSYGVNASGAPSLFPRKEYSISIGFGCSPDRVDELIAAVMQQVDSLKIAKPAPIYVEKVQELQRRGRETSLKENGFWMSIIRTNYANHENPEEQIQLFNKFVDGLTGDAIQKAARKYLDTSNVVKVVLFPENKSEKK